MYHFYLGDVHLPVAPSELTIKTGSQNKVVSLADGSEINIIKSPKLKEIQFHALLPNREYAFSNYLGSYTPANDIKSKIEAYKINKQPFQFVVSRSRGNEFLFFTDIRVALEDITATESAEEGFDMLLNIKLREYVDYGTQVYSLNNDNTVTVTNTRQTDNMPSGNTYTVKSGDCLWDIAKAYYGDGSKYTQIYNANKDIISNPRLISVGMVLTIP